MAHFSARTAKLNWYHVRMQKPVVNVMVKAARQAGTVILRHMSKLDSLNVVEKNRQDYASEVDSLAEKEIIKELRRSYPDVAILAEESGAMGKGRQTFVIDRSTHVFAKGTTTALAATGGKAPFTDLVAAGDRVSVSYRKAGSSLHAADVRVTMKAAR